MIDNFWAYRFLNIYFRCVKINSMQFLDTYKKQQIKFKPEASLIKIYVCGITPYDSAHLGHIFTFMTYDLLERRLEDLGYEVRLVRNITDVDEPIYLKAAELKIPYMELANREVEKFHQVLAKLNFKDLYAEPRASQYINEMSDAVRQLVDKGFGYKLANGDIYFDTARYSKYLSLPGFKSDIYQKLLKMRGGNPELSTKRNPLDFLLWKAINDPNDPAQWQSVNGQGRPGWHIECSVMSKTTLGHIDIHGGGTDLIFPHHSSEIAQSYGLGDQQLVDYWLHVSPLLFWGEKMSKSLGNLVFAADLLVNYAPSVIRLSLMNYHYSFGGEWQMSLLDEMTKLYLNIKSCLSHASSNQLVSLIETIRAHLDNNLDTEEIIVSFKQFCENVQVNSSPAPDNHQLINKLQQLTGLEF